MTESDDVSASNQTDNTVLDPELRDLAFNTDDLSQRVGDLLEARLRAGVANRNGVPVEVPEDQYERARLFVQRSRIIIDEARFETASLMSNPRAHTPEGAIAVVREIVAGAQRKLLTHVKSAKAKGNGPTLQLMEEAVNAFARPVSDNELKDDSILQTLEILSSSPPLDVSRFFSRRAPEPPKNGTTITKGSGNTPPETTAEDPDQNEETVAEDIPEFRWSWTDEELAKVDHVPQILEFESSTDELVLSLEKLYRELRGHLRVVTKRINPQATEEDIEAVFRKFEKGMEPNRQNALKILQSRDVRLDLLQHITKVFYEFFNTEWRNEKEKEDLRNICDNFYNEISKGNPIHYKPTFKGALSGVVRLIHKKPASSVLTEKDISHADKKELITRMAVQSWGILYGGKPRGKIAEVFYSCINVLDNQKIFDVKPEVGSRVAFVKQSKTILRTSLVAISHVKSGNISASDMMRIRNAWSMGLSFTARVSTLIESTAMIWPDEDQSNELEAEFLDFYPHPETAEKPPLEFRREWTDEELFGKRPLPNVRLFNANREGIEALWQRMKDDILQDSLGSNDQGYAWIPKAKLDAWLSKQSAKTRQAFSSEAFAKKSREHILLAFTEAENFLASYLFDVGIRADELLSLRADTLRVLQKGFTWFCSTFDVEVPDFVESHFGRFFEEATASSESLPPEHLTGFLSDEDVRYAPSLPGLGFSKEALANILISGGKYMLSLRQEMIESLGPEPHRNDLHEAHVIVDELERQLRQFVDAYARGGNITDIAVLAREWKRIMAQCMQIISDFTSNQISAELLMSLKNAASFHIVRTAKGAVIACGQTRPGSFENAGYLAELHDFYTEPSETADVGPRPDKPWSEITMGDQGVEELLASLPPLPPLGPQGEMLGGGTVQAALKAQFDAMLARCKTDVPLMEEKAALRINTFQRMTDKLMNFPFCSALDCAELLEQLMGLTETSAVYPATGKERSYQHWHRIEKAYVMQFYQHLLSHFGSQSAGNPVPGALSDSDMVYANRERVLETFDLACVSMHRDLPAMIPQGTAAQGLSEALHAHIDRYRETVHAYLREFYPEEMSQHTFYGFAAFMSQSFGRMAYDPRLHNMPMQIHEKFLDIMNGMSNQLNGESHAKPMQPGDIAFYLKRLGTISSSIMADKALYRPGMNQVINAYGAMLAERLTQKLPPVIGRWEDMMNEQVLRELIDAHVDWNNAHMANLIKQYSVNAPLMRDVLEQNALVIFVAAAKNRPITPMQSVDAKLLQQLLRFGNMRVQTFINFYCDEDSIQRIGRVDTAMEVVGQKIAALCAAMPEHFENAESVLACVTEAIEIYQGIVPALQEWKENAGNGAAQVIRRILSNIPIFLSSAKPFGMAEPFPLSLRLARAVPIGVQRGLLEQPITESELKEMTKAIFESTLDGFPPLLQMDDEEKKTRLLPALLRFRKLVLQAVKKATAKGPVTTTEQYQNFWGQVGAVVQHMEEHLSGMLSNYLDVAIMEKRDELERSRNLSEENAAPVLSLLSVYDITPEDAAARISHAAAEHLSHAAAETLALHGRNLSPADFDATTAELRRVAQLVATTTAAALSGAKMEALSGAQITAIIARALEAAVQSAQLPDQFREDLENAVTARRSGLRTEDDTSLVEYLIEKSEGGVQALEQTETIHRTARNDEQERQWRMSVEEMDAMALADINDFLEMRDRLQALSKQVVTEEERRKISEMYQRLQTIMRGARSVFPPLTEQ